ISNRFGIAISCGTSPLSTRSTRAIAGPCPRARSSSVSAGAEPSTITSTEPSGRFRAMPRNPNRSAAFQTNHLNPTPCTLPCTTKRAAGTELLLPALRQAAPVPPDVHRGDRGEHRQDDQQRPPRVGLGFGVEDGHDHILLLADEPADPGQDRAPHERAETREGDELGEVHPRQARR